MTSPALAREAPPMFGGDVVVGVCAAGATEFTLRSQGATKTKIDSVPVKGSIAFKDAPGTVLAANAEAASAPVAGPGAVTVCDCANKNAQTPFLSTSRRSPTSRDPRLFLIRPLLLYSDYISFYLSSSHHHSLHSIVVVSFTAESATDIDRKRINKWKKMACWWYYYY